MDKKVKLLIKAVKEKRERLGLSFRKLSDICSVSFPTLSRLEKLESEPDDNTKIRLINWLGEDATKVGITSQLIAEVHFRASKNVDSKTAECLIELANAVKDSKY